MRCYACQQNPAVIGLLCDECRDELRSPLRLAPEQVVSRPASGAGPRAALLDSWGRAHLLDPRTVVGRQIEGTGLSLLEASISRHHAHITYDASAQRWRVRDLGSANGTMVNEHPIAEAVDLNQADRVSFGQVGFYFIADAQALPQVQLDPKLAETIKPEEHFTLADVVRRERAATQPPSASDFAPTENTDVGIPILEISLVEPTGGGGGVVTIEDKQVQLTMTQYELVALLVRRMEAEAQMAESVRGFVRSSELIADLSWDTRDPGDNHVKQLVRRVRRALFKAEIGDLIESRHRFGYRLRALPASPKKA